MDMLDRHPDKPYRAATEHAAEIRQTLKSRHGWSSRQVSVRAEYFSMGSAIRVEIRDAAIPLPTVKAIAECAESIRRDGLGEILSGGNRYVTVRYSDPVMKILGRRYADAVERAVAALPAGDDRRLEPIEGTPFLVGRPQPGRLTLWDMDAGAIAHEMSKEGLAQTIGALMVAREGAS